MNNIVGYKGVQLVTISQSTAYGVNSKIKDESALGKLMHDFSYTDAKDMRYKILADCVRYFKEDEEEVAIMCKAMEEMRKEELIEVAEHLLKF